MSDVDVIEVVVVGAGPAGCCAAIHLARRGHRVLILERGGSTDATQEHGWLLSLDALDLLVEAGALPAQSVAIAAATVHVRGRYPRTFPFTPDGQPLQSRVTKDPRAGRLVAPTSAVIEALRAAAIAAGAMLRLGVEVIGPLLTDGAVAGVCTLEGGTQAAVHSRAIVAADGAASTLAQSAGLRLDSRAEGRGFALHAVLNGADPRAVLGRDRIRLDLPLADPTNRWVMPSCGWLLPSGPRSLTGGVALFEDDDPEECSEVLFRYLHQLREELPDLRAARTGRPRGGGVRLDLDAARSATRGLVLVGDAAGLSSAFTAEGVSAALESGKLAALAVDAALTSDLGHGPLDLDAYGHTLGTRFGAYTASGRYAVHRYQLAWRVLQSTFDDDRPLFTLTRRAALFPETARAESLLDPLPPIQTDLRHTLRRELVGVAEVVATALQEQWPLFVRAPGVDRNLAGLHLRPSALLLITRHTGDQNGSAVTDGDTLATVLGAAVDLGALSAVAVDSTADIPPNANLAGASARGDDVPWGNRFAVLVADVLMARAYALSAQAGPAAVDLFVEALANACIGRIRDVRSTRRREEPPDVRTLAEKAALSFELPCRLGALLAGSSPPAVEALRQYGRHLGITWIAVEELRRNRGQGHPWLPSQDASQPDWTTLPDIITTNARAASDALRKVPDGPARTLLKAIAAEVGASAER